MEANLHEESKLWSFVVLCQSKSRMQGGKREKSNMKKFKRTTNFGHISSILWSPFYAYYMFFRSLGSQESNASNSTRIGVEMKKLWPLEDNRIKLCENFAAAKSTFCCENFAAQSPFRNCKMSCETTCKHTCATSQVKTPSSQQRTTLRNHLQAAKQVTNHLQVAESPPSCEITNSTCKIKVQTCKMDN